MIIGSGLTLLLVGLLALEGRASLSFDSMWQGSLFTGVFAVLACLGTWEFLTLARQKVGRAGLVIPLAGVFALVSLRFWAAAAGLPLQHWAVLGIVMAVFLFAAAIRQARVIGITGALENLGLTCLTLVYLGIGGMFVVEIRLLGNSWASYNLLGQASLVFWFLITVKSADIGAYLMGSVIGRHAWVPGISPRKTWEGFIGGIILAIIVAFLGSQMFGIIGVGASVLFGLGMGVCGQFGDLLESLFKRDAGIKDSASLIPAFGGVLDLLDSILVASPFAYLFLTLCR